MKHNIELLQKGSSAMEKLFKSLTLPIMPTNRLIFPGETTSIEFTDARTIALLQNAQRKYGFVGFSYCAPDAAPGELPPDGHLGVAAAVEIEKLWAHRHLARFAGLVRYHADGYAARAEFPVVEYTLFDDEDSTTEEAQRELARFFELEKETILVRGDEYKIDRSPFMDTQSGFAELLSFACFTPWMGLSETRYEILAMNSTLERLRLLNAQIYRYNRNEAVAERFQKNN